MATPVNLEMLIENIFAGEQIDNSQLKECLKIISNQLRPSAENTYTEGTTACDEEGEYEEVFQVQYLSELITQCERRLEKLAETPKTKVVIRNEGEKLQSIVESLECVKATNSQLQVQIDDLSAAHKKFKQLECDRRQKYQDMIDRLYPTSMNSDVCNLRRMYYGLQEQVDQLIVKCTAMQKEIVDIQKKIVILDVIPALEEKVEMLLNWRASLREELDQFVDRYEHLKTVKAGKCEVQDMLEKKVDYCHLVKYVQKTSFDCAKEEFVAEFKQIKELFCDLQIFLSARLVGLHKDVQMVLTKLASKRRLEKRSI